MSEFSGGHIQPAKPSNRPRLDLLGFPSDLNSSRGLQHPEGLSISVEETRGSRYLSNSSLGVPLYTHVNPHVPVTVGILNQVRQFQFHGAQTQTATSPQGGTEVSSSGSPQPLGKRR